MASGSRIAIVPAAGLSQRYRDAGIRTPKPLLRMDWNGVDATMLEHALGAWHDDETVVACRAHDGPAFEEAIRDGHVVTVGDTTRGQAQTVRLALEGAGLQQANRPVVVANCDAGSLYPLNVFSGQGCDYSAAALVFDGNGETAYSYVGSYPLFQEAVEKHPASPWAMAGFYAFRSAWELHDALQRQEAMHCGDGELYLSGTFRYLYEPCLAVYMPRGQLRVWGTPEDLARDDQVSLNSPEETKILEALR